MDVRVDQGGHHRLSGEVDPLRAGGAGKSPFRPIRVKRSALDDERGVFDRRRAVADDQAGAFEERDT